MRVQPSLFISVLMGWFHHVQSTEIYPTTPLYWMEGDVRLLNGSMLSEGRVEVYWQSHWRVVCDDDWDLTDANVVCRQLGYPAASEVVLESGFGDGEGEILLDDVMCTGYETFLIECDSNGFFNHDCRENEIAGVVCATEENNEFCNSSSLEENDQVHFTYKYETYAKDEKISLSCKDSSLELTPFIQEIQCLGGDGWSHQLPDCGEMTTVSTVVSLNGIYNENLANKSSTTFLQLEKQVCDAFATMLTKSHNTNVKDGYNSCYVESFSNGGIIADVVTKYKQEENVTPQQVTNIITTEADQHEHYTIPSLGLNFTDESKIISRGTKHVHHYIQITKIY